MQSQTVVVRGQILNYFCQMSSVRPIRAYSNYEFKPMVASLILDWKMLYYVTLMTVTLLYFFFSLGDRDNFWMRIFFFNLKRQVGVVAVKNFCLKLKCNTLSKPKSDSQRIWIGRWSLPKPMKQRLEHISVKVCRRDAPKEMFKSRIK